MPCRSIYGNGGRAAMQLNALPFPVYGDAAFRGKCPKEDIEQISFFNRLRREYPDSYGLIALHPRNEGLKRGGQFSAVVKHAAEGMTKGAADIIIPGRRAFVCELKRRDHTQSAWQAVSYTHLKLPTNREV